MMSELLRGESEHRIEQDHLDTKPRWTAWMPSTGPSWSGGMASPCMW